MLRLKAKVKRSGEDVIVKPVFFEYYMGIEFKPLTGWMADSVFCRAKQDFIFPIQSEIILFFVKIWFWISRYAYVKMRRMLNKARRLCSQKRNDDLPF